jgi:hypothetical protein
MVGFIDPLGTSFQSATAERSEPSASSMIASGRIQPRHSRCPFVGFVDVVVTQVSVGSTHYTCLFIADPFPQPSFYCGKHALGAPPSQCCDARRRTCIPLALSYISHAS